MRAFLAAYLSILVMSLFVVNTSNAHENMNMNEPAFNSKYVTPRKNPEHFLRYNASRTCGKGYNAMTKQHRRNHRFRRAHTHLSSPWSSECQS